MNAMGVDMELRVVTAPVMELETPLLVLGLVENGGALASPLVEADAALGGIISQAVAEKEVGGKPSELVVFHAPLGLPARHIAVVGLGKREEVTPDRLRQAAGIAARRAGTLKAKEIAVALFSTTGSGVQIESAAEAIAEGVALGSYQYRTYKSVKDELAPALERLTIIASNAEAEAAESGAQRGLVTGKAGAFARDLVNGPANLVTPTYLVDRAREMAQRYNLGFEALDQLAMAGLGMGALLAVAQGSAQPAFLIVLRYAGAGVGRPTLALVGKAITFDSGGISLKPTEGLQTMKYDMAGGAAVLAATQALAELHAPVNLLAVVPATENVPSGAAYKPGDILTAANGKTIEVITTDAEGRLVLADALTYAAGQETAAIVDIATLTGACMVALASAAAGLLTNDEGLHNLLQGAAELSGEKVWRLPLWPYYNELIKSDVADIKNAGGRYGGAPVGGAFLANFVADKPWAHLDIAGMASTEKDLPYMPKGATGFGARLLADFAVRWAAAQPERT